MMMHKEYSAPGPIRDEKILLDNLPRAPSLGFRWLYSRSISPQSAPLYRSVSAVDA